MILLLFFLFFWIGLSFRYAVLLFTVVVILLAILVFRRYKSKLCLLCLGITFIGVGISYIRIDIQKENFSGIVIDSKDNYFVLLSKGEKLYAYNKDNEYEIGDYLYVKGKKEELDFVVLESQFDFKDYLNKKGIYYSIDVKGIEVKFTNPIKIRKTRNKFLNHFDEQKRSLIKSMLFSEHEDNNDLNNIDKLHLSRLVNASGIYIYAYLRFFTFILSYFIKDKRIKIVSLITLVPYFIFTFPRLTVLRIMIMELLRYINEIFFNKKIKSLELLSINGFILLLFDFHNAYQMSFILGMSMPIIISLIRDMTFMYKRFKKKVVDLFYIYIAFIPFEFKFYNGINPLSIVLQTLLSPLFIALATMSLLCFYGVPIYGAVSFLLTGVSNLLGWLSKISIQINGPPFNEWYLLGYILLLLSYCYFRSIEFIPIYRLNGLIEVVYLLFRLIPLYMPTSMQVSFINVGQGDSCLIRKGNTAVLIDTGGLKNVDVGKSVLIPFLEKQGIYDIDLVITTHDDYDHTGALDSLKNNYYVKDVVKEATAFPININGITFSNYNNHIGEYSEKNDNSLVIGFTLMNKSFLITGDAPKEVERNIINEYEHIDCDILKVGHHGSDTSTCDEFIKFLKPKVGIISCGKNNKYGHPKKSVLKILEDNNVKIRRTDIEGTITYRNYIFM